MNIITGGAAGETTKTTESIQEIYPGHPTIENRPVVHPYGFVSRAKKGTLAVTAQQGSHPGNKMTLGHRNPNAPDIDEGESAQYSSGGYAVRVYNNQIQVGKNGVYETVVVGETLKAFLITIVDLIVAHTHLGNLGFPTGVPVNAAAFTSAKDESVANDKILAKDGGRF